MGFSTVVVIGLGYIGLPTAAILAANDVDVVGVDINPTTVDAVNEGKVPFVEPDLGTLLAGAVGRGRLRAASTPEPADAFILAVPTPFADDHKPDLSYVKAAAEAVAPLLRGGELVVLESTSPPGATSGVAEWVLAIRPDLSVDGADGRPAIHFAHCPERVLPGRVIVELVENDRVIGGLTATATERARDLYSVFCKGQLLVTDSTTAEMTKLVENAYRDINIAFANELSLIADKLQIDVWELIKLANHHPRVNILSPGPGVGGHCIAVDPWFIVDAAPESARLIRTARMVNDTKPRWVVEKVLEAVTGINSPTIAALGLAFKADIDDLRESPAIEVVRDLAHVANAQILAVEPHIKTLPASLGDAKNLCLTDLETALDAADVVVVLVDHSAFRNAVGLLAASAQVIDTRGVLS
ncbi:UDP-N-acetyl-D-mannosamine dehydrogenase [Xylanimonas ulmi]|uniref:UDP-N-acetyl-D-mannosaminuronic acid dehydrogenase n=1 Tax=Xylanimonas ulmi TaxID=228973 RepID=A0A4Q7M3Y3_9MICO|nr:UDP-N-acetyl-D-mannosamine dehydrogenase [Xylanibacterium ulmi]RZS62061.1 UDP-N-acetyl-D-mannosaminuronic acid dehydrogenase [Xylanibacterium ulmi]